MPGNATISAGSTLVVNSGGSLFAFGTLTNNGCLVNDGRFENTVL